MLSTYLIRLVSGFALALVLCIRRDLASIPLSCLKPNFHYFYPKVGGDLTRKHTLDDPYLNIQKVLSSSTQNLLLRTSKYSDTFCTVFLSLSGPYI